MFLARPNCTTSSLSVTLFQTNFLYAWAVHGMFIAHIGTNRLGGGTSAYLYRSWDTCKVHTSLWSVLVIPLTLLILMEIHI
jgi:hypothetical protein